MTWDPVLPKFVRGSALECGGEVIGEQPSNDEGTDCVEPDSESGRGEDSAVEEQDRQLDCCNGQTVELEGDVVCLPENE